MINKCMETGTNKENMWKHGKIWQLWKGTREQGTSWETLRYAKHDPPWFHSRVWPEEVLGSVKLARQVHQRTGRASQLSFDPLAIDNILSITEQKSCFLVSLTSSSSSRHERTKMTSEESENTIFVRFYFTLVCYLMLNVLTDGQHIK